MRTIRISISLVALVTVLTIVAAGQTPAPVRVAVLDFGDGATGARAAEKFREALLADRQAAANGVVLIDRNLAIAAARGSGFQGSLNLTTIEARDMGAAIGCDFFIIGDADTVRRSPSTGAAYFESYAAIFIVSARTGQLISWRRPAERRDTADEAEKALLQGLGSESGSRVPILRAAEDERAARAEAVETPAAAIEIMSDDESGRKTDTRAPRPYRRLKPAYPEPAAQAEVEATVDVMVDIDAKGEISHLEIARWAGYGLDQSVLDTVKQMHFFPAMRDDAPIPMRVLLRYNFRHPTPDQSTSIPDTNKPKIIIKPQP
jgi:TonB family protein